MAKNKRQQPESQSYHSSIPQVDQNADEQDPQPEPPQQINEELINAQLLELIGNNVVNQKNDGLRLSWQALYGLKNQEISLNKMMVQEIQQAKDKYDFLKEPIFRQISDAVLGNKIQQKLSQEAKNNKLGIPGFWKTVFTKAGLLNEQIVQDVQCLHKLQSISCSLLNNKSNNFQITFKFDREPKYFKNKQLQIDIQLGEDGQQSTSQVKNAIRYKSERKEQSLFTQLFDTSDHQAAAFLGSEIFQTYRNALYFYFSKFHEQIIAFEEESVKFQTPKSGKKINKESSSKKSSTSKLSPLKKSPLAKKLFKNNKML